MPLTRRRRGGAPGADGFRNRPQRDEPSDSWNDLVRYAEDSNRYLDRSGSQFALVDTGFKRSVQEMLNAACPRYHPPRGSCPCQCPAQVMLAAVV
ncbi:hypothetical protein ABZ725_29445 [Streptomyces sp. NPDC006872]|uniref:hypothetical protein n=1 Tax=Streptomyces sp. NPDC006872 TaxID=3155720 RepID=UPI0033C0A32F